MLWKSILPAIVERCRIWSHGSSCEYKSVRAAPLSIKPKEPFLCTYGHGHGHGHGLNNFVPVPDWERVASKFATRVAVCPIFCSAVVKNR